MSILSKIVSHIALLKEMNSRLIKIQNGVGRIEQRQLAGANDCCLVNNEFQVYSQWGEDGIIQFLLNKVAIDRPIFVEFGVEQYTESNTRFLLINNNWSGLVIDGSESNINYIKRDPIYWKYNLKAECAFIDKDNINNLIEKNGISGDIGLLSVDIDGNDYWVWNEINVVNPRIIICEYNSIFGPEERVTIPYSASFFRTDSHYSNLYYGASISALTQLANSKGYALVGGNQAGNNVFFVRRDLMHNLKEMSPQDAYVKSKFRESRDEGGNLTFLSMDERLRLLKDMKVVNIDDSKEYSIGDVYHIQG